MKEKPTALWICKSRQIHLSSGMKKNRHKEDNQTADGVINQQTDSVMPPLKKQWLLNQHQQPSAMYFRSDVGRRNSTNSFTRSLQLSRRFPPESDIFPHRKNEYSSAPLSRTHATENRGRIFNGFSNFYFTDLAWRKTVTKNNQTSLVTHDGMPPLNQAVTVESA